MNLHTVANGVISAVNPNVGGSIKVSTGYTTADDGARTPTYDTVTIKAQVQALSFMDLKQLDGINMNGRAQAIYFWGQYNGVVRPDVKGGDLITLTGGANAGTWLVTKVLEQWSDGATPTWCKVAATLQNGS